MMKFILASSSPRRRELLGSLGISFTIIKPDIDETQRPNEPPLVYVTRLSQEKAAAVGTRHVVSNEIESEIILAADTVVILGADTLGVDEHGDILGKPVDADDARDMLRQLRGRTHQVCTAMTLCMIGTQNHPSLEYHTRITSTDVTIRDYSDAEIDAYIATGDPFDKAGSYAIQHSVFRPVAKIDGCYTNVVGLPLCTLKNMLAEIGGSGIATVTGCDCDPNLLSS
jgi:septum formation protein